jgi:Cdc6-like AAA superfamily ATPase
VFSTYSKEDLIQIVVDRVEKGIIHEKAVEFAASKVAAGKGDARFMLELIRSAVHNCLQSMTPSQQLSTMMDGPLVTIPHIMKAVKETKSLDNYCEIIESLPHVNKIVLCVAVTLGQVSPSWSTIPIAKLHQWTRSVIGLMNPDDEFSIETFRDCVSSLFDQGLLKSDDEPHVNTVSWTSGHNMLIRLGCQLQDVESALEETLGDNKFYGGVLERVRKIDIENGDKIFR